MAKRYWICGLVISGCVWISIPVIADESAMNGAFWKFVNQIEKAFPLTREKVEELLGISLERQGGNSAFGFFVGGPVQMNDATISNIDLRVPERDPMKPPLLSFSIEGPCIEYAEVGRNYGSLMLANVPSGRSEEEETAYAVDRPWGRLTFGFSEKRPDCLNSVTFDPAERKPR